MLQGLSGARGTRGDPAGRFLAGNIYIGLNKIDNKSYKERIVRKLESDERTRDKKKNFGRIDLADH